MLDTMFLNLHIPSSIIIKRQIRQSLTPKEILIGNAVIHDTTDSAWMYDLLATHAIISDKAAYDVNKVCDFSSSYNLTTECNSIQLLISSPLAQILLAAVVALVYFSKKIKFGVINQWSQLQAQFFTSDSHGSTCCGNLESRFQCKCGKTCYNFTTTTTNSAIFFHPPCKA